MIDDRNDRSAEGQSRERQILDASLRLFRARGFDGVTVDEIGREAGLHGPGIYRSFQNKVEILATLFDEAMDRLQQLAGPVRESPREELDALVDAQVAFAIADRGLLSVYAREDRSLTGDARRRLNRRQRAHMDRWVAAIAAVYPHREPADHIVAANAAIGLLLSVTRWPEDALAHPELSRQLRTLTTNGLSGLRQ